MRYGTLRKFPNLRSIIQRDQNTPSNSRQRSAEGVFSLGAFVPEVRRIEI
jgi:hypothetical protein